jgi:anti-sigma factor ChrR (cupin superfamily)
MDAGSSYPRHVHNGAEECLVLEGDIRMGDAVLHAGDYQYAPPDTLHGVQSTEKGCLLLITSSLSDELV